MTMALPENVSLIRWREVADPRGDLIVGECQAQIPFSPQRIFFIHRVPGQQSRGEHAHRECHQLLICVKGSITVLVDDGTRRAELVLDDPALALHIPPMIWAAQYHYSPDAMLMVVASHAYDEHDYLREYNAWRREVASAGGPTSHGGSDRPG